MGPTIKVQVLYEFTGEPGTDELSISEGEILTVTRQDVGEGWWEGKNSSGQTGLFPAAYVANYNTTDFWGEDEWEDEESVSSTVESHPPPAYQAPSYQPPEPPPSIVSTAPMHSLSTSSSASRVLQPSTSIKGKYGNFKAGGENFIVGTNVVAVPDEERIEIVLDEGFIVWSPLLNSYSCVLASHKKESKLKGLKSYISYQLTPSFNNIQVSRRYKHFDWLHERLEEKFCYIPIPPLPEKQISGRYEEQFIEHRKHQLQFFVDSVCRHPVLSRSSVWQHFMTCTDDKLWKTGKRKAERDELVGDNFFHSVVAPSQPVNQFALEQDTVSCSKFVTNMDAQVKHLMEVAIDQSKKYQGPLKREFQKVGHAFYTFGQGINSDVPQICNTANLTNAVKKVGDAYNEIGKMFDEQPKSDWEPLSYMLHVYKGILASVPEILGFHKKSLAMKRDYERYAFEQKITPEHLEEVNRRTDILSYSVLAEINHFHKDAAEEINKTLKSFIGEQIKFYQKIVDELQGAYEAFED